jgi:hypothetical protein
MLANTYKTKKGTVTLFLHQYHIQGEGFWLQNVIADKPGSTTMNPNQAAIYVKAHICHPQGREIQECTTNWNKSWFTVFWNEKMCYSCELHV